jgi:hypothetical protein
MSELDRTMNGTPNAHIKALQQAVKSETGRKPKIPELLVLSSGKDPFYSGSPADIAKAVWFREWFENTTGPIKGQHLRRIHYRLVSHPGTLRPDGNPYINDQTNWDFLNTASRHARYLRYVDPEDVDDRRNPPADINMDAVLQDDPSFTYSTDMNRLDRINPTLEVESSFLPLVGWDTEVFGYVYEQAMQPYHLEIWAEKTTANSVLIPLCRELGVNYVSGAGYMSITAIVQLLRDRVDRIKKPVRIFYISDYDKSGENMPRQMSRQMQFWIDVYASEHDIKVEPIVMTEEQSRDYPKAPDSNKVELDAMLELDPGRLERIVREALSEYRDFDLEANAAETEREAEETLEEAIEEELKDELEELEKIKHEAEMIYRTYRGPLKRSATELNNELRPLDRRLETLQQAVEEKLAGLDVVLPDLPESELEEDEDKEWLYSSERDYEEQLEVYKERKGRAE